MTHGLIRPVSHLIGILRYLTKNEKLSGVLITGSKYEYNFFSNTGHWILYWLCYLCLMKDLSMLVVMDVERERQPHCFKDQCWYKMFHWDLSNTGYAHTWPHTRHTYLHEHTHIHGRTHAHTHNPLWPQGFRFCSSSSLLAITWDAHSCTLSLMCMINIYHLSFNAKRGRCSR